MLDISESDWRIWSALRKDALQLYCARVLEGAAQFKTGDGSSHSRYLQLYKFIKQSDEELAQIFDDHRRSTAVLHIGLAAKAKLISDADVKKFSEPVQSSVQFWMDK